MFYPIYVDIMNFALKNKDKVYVLLFLDCCQNVNDDFDRNKGLLV